MYTARKEFTEEEIAILKTSPHVMDLPPKKNKLKCEHIYDIQSFDCFTQFEAEGELPPVKQKLR